jgi:phage/plasmid-associated DNA primase
MKPQAMVDEFISECLLSTTDSKHVIRNKQLYDWYEQWSKHADLPVMTDSVFGRYLSKRFHRTRRNGKVYYFCSLNPKVSE